MDKIIYPIHYSKEHKQEELEKTKMVCNKENGDQIVVTCYVPKSDSADSQLPIVTAPITRIDPNLSLVRYESRCNLSEDNLGNPILVNSMIPVYSHQTSSDTTPINCYATSIQTNQQKDYSLMEQIIQNQYAPSTRPKPIFSNNYTPISLQKQEKIEKRLSVRELAEIVCNTINIRVNSTTEQFFIFNSTIYQQSTVNNIKRTISFILDNKGIEIQNPKKIDEIFEVLKKSYYITVSTSYNNPRYVAFTDKLLDLKNGLFVDPDPNIFLTWRIECSYNQIKKFYENNSVNSLSLPVNFNNFLSTISGGNPLLVKRIWQVIGLLLTNDVSCKKIILFQGVGNSGKSKLAEFIKSLINSDSSFELTFADFSEKFSLSNIPGKHLVCSMDLPYMPISDTAASRLKSISSGGSDEISVEPKYQQKYMYKPEVQCLFGTNHAVQFKVEDINLIRRFVVVPFNYRVPDDKIDANLLQKFEFEKSLIIFHALQAYFELKNMSYEFAGDFELNGNRYLLTKNNDADFLSVFIDEKCVFDAKSFCSTQLLYLEYSRFLQSYSINGKIDIKGFSRRLSQLYGQQIKNGKRNCKDAVNNGNGFWRIKLRS